MDKKSKIFFLVFFTLIAGVVAVTYVKYFVAKDYYIEAQADCDPTIDKCFIWKCDPEAADESEKCTGDPEKDIWYYQKVRKIANEIPTCDPNDENCNPWECVSGADCQVTFCDENAAEEEKAECNDPVKYNEENPPVTDEGECAPGDEECESSQNSEEICSPDDENCNASEEMDSGGDENIIPEENTSNNQPDDKAKNGDESAVEVLNSIG